MATQNDQPLPIIASDADSSPQTHVEVSTQLKDFVEVGRVLQLPKDFVDLHAPAISSLTLVSELCGEQSPVEHHVHHYLDEAGQKSLNIDVRADAVDGWWQQMGSISFGRFQPPSSHPTASNSPPP